MTREAVLNRPSVQTIETQIHAAEVSQIPTPQRKTLQESTLRSLRLAYSRLHTPGLGSEESEIIQGKITVIESIAKRNNIQVGEKLEEVAKRIQVYKV